MLYIHKNKSNHDDNNRNTGNHKPRHEMEVAKERRDFAISKLARTPAGKTANRTPQAHKCNDARDEI